MKKRFGKLISAFAAVSLLSTSIALATPQSRPNGPWVQDEQNLSMSSFMSNEELYDKLAKIEAASQGRMTLDIAGYSNSNPTGDLTEEKGYPLYVAKFGGDGEGKTRVMITSQIHGNEAVTTEAAVELMQKLAAGGNEVDEILDKVSVWFMPRINPDGAANTYEGELYHTRYSLQNWTPELYGLDGSTTAPWYYNADGSERAQNNDGRVVYGVPGYDQNRDYNPNLNFRPENIDAQALENFFNETYVRNGRTYRTYNNSNYGGFYVTPEARIVTKVFQEFEPHVYFDLHHRGFNTVSDTDNRSVSIQVAADVALPYEDPFTGQEYSVDEEVLKLSKQINALGYLSLQRGNSSFGAIQKYPKVNLPGTALGAFALNDTSIMLIEVKGQSQTLGQKEIGMLKQTVKEPIYTILKALSDGSIHDVDPAIYEAIPESTNSISNPHDSAEEDIMF